MVVSKSTTNEGRDRYLSSTYTRLRRVTVVLEQFLLHAIPKEDEFTLLSLKLVGEHLMIVGNKAGELGLVQHVCAG